MAKMQKEAGTSGEGGGGTSGRGGVSDPKGGVSGRASKGFAGAHNLDYSLHICRFGEVYMLCMMDPVLTMPLGPFGSLCLYVLT